MSRILNLIQLSHSEHIVLQTLMSPINYNHIPGGKQGPSERNLKYLDHLVEGGYVCGNKVEIGWFYIHIKLQFGDNV